LEILMGNSSIRTEIHAAGDGIGLPAKSSHQSLPLDKLKHRKREVNLLLRWS
jgi:hypothetical protein